ncbi:MAG: hypothetical protein GXP45_06745 [bacterium]|nr:hypothetical protein [bacterium]
MEAFCPAPTIGQARSAISSFGIQLDKTLQRLTNYQKLTYLQNFYHQLLTLAPRIFTSNINNYCRQNYSIYYLAQKVQDQYLTILKDKGLAGEMLLWNDLDEDKTQVLLPSINKQLSFVDKKLQSANVPENIDIKAVSLHDFGNEASQKLKSKVVELTSQSIKSVLADMLQNHIIDKQDITLLKDKIKVNYVRGCQATKGSYNIHRVYSGVYLQSTELKELDINVNLCPSFEYLNNLQSYVTEIFSHEMGHHIYYFKDNHPQDFQHICRFNEQHKICPSEGFVSKYAETKPEEDYAESFLHRYQKDSTMNSNSVLQNKKNYFDHLVASYDTSLSQ